MTRIPHEAGTASFTPPSLRNLPDPPRFFIRYADRRLKTAFADLLMMEGLEPVSQDQVRAETRNGLRALWDDQSFAEHEPRLLAYWDALDFHIRNTPDVPFEHPDQQAILRLVESVTEAWRPLRVMSAKIVRYRADSPRHLLRVTLVGWSGIDVRFSKEQGLIPIETIDALAEALDKIEQANVELYEGVLPGLAFRELGAEAAEMMFLDEATAKNSESPSNSTASPKTSKKAGKAKGSGRSAATRSNETPAS